MKINKLNSKIENNNLKILEYQKKIKSLEEENLKTKKLILKEKDKEILNIVKSANISVSDLNNLILSKQIPTNQETSSFNSDFKNHDERSF